MHFAVLLATVLWLGCAGSSGPRLDALPLRDAAACGAAASAAAEDPGAGSAALDVVFGLETSTATRWPSGADVDGDGETGRFERSRMTDPGDSQLAAQVVGVRSALRSARLSDARFALVSYSGRVHFPLREPRPRVVPAEDARILVEVTADSDAIDAGLERALARGSWGNTDFAAGLELALRALERADDGGAPRRRRVVLLSHSPRPVLAEPRRAAVRSDVFRSYPASRLLVAVRRAQRAGIAVHTIGLGEAAGSSTPHTLASIARVSGGAYHPVADPTRVHCALLNALATP